MSRSIHLRMRNVSDQVVEKIESHICVQKLFFFYENRGVYEIMWEKNIFGTDKPQMTL
jgi:hypothetical protein